MFWIVLKWVVVIAACGGACSVDVRCRRIPNLLTVPLCLTGLLCSLIAGGWSGLGDSFTELLIAGLPFFVLWMIGGGGAGDAKMMFAIGAWLGTSDAFIAAIAVGLAGGILSLIYAGTHKRLAAALANTTWMMFTLPFVLLGPGRFSDRQKLVPASADGPLKTPYSLAMLAGTAAAAAWVFTWPH